MEYIKELFEAIAGRSRSHFFGAIALSFLALNWQPLYFVAYTDIDILDRFAYFDSHVKFWQPIVSGAFLALATPALAWGGAWWAEKFTTRVKVIQARAASSIAIKEMTFENDRAAEKAKIAITVDETLGKIEDEEVRDKFREDALSTDNTAPPRSMKRFDVELKSMTNVERYLLLRMHDSDSGILTISKDYGKALTLINGQPLKDNSAFSYEVAAVNLESGGYIASMVTHNSQLQIFQLTDTGREIAEFLRDNPIN